VEIKKSNLYGVSMGGNLCRFSNAAAKSVWWNIPSAQNRRSILQVQDAIFIGFSIGYWGGIRRNGT